MIYIVLIVDGIVIVWPNPEPRQAKLGSFLARMPAPTVASLAR
jgi:hypothetical protein